MDSNLATFGLRVDAPILLFDNVGTVMFTSYSVPDAHQTSPMYFAVFVVRVYTERFLIRGFQDKNIPFLRFTIKEEVFPNFIFKPWNMFVFCQTSNQFPAVFFEHYAFPNTKDITGSATEFVISPFFRKLTTDN